MGAAGLNHSLAIDEKGDAVAPESLTDAQKAAPEVIARRRIVRARRTRGAERNAAEPAETTAAAETPAGDNKPAEPAEAPAAKLPAAEEKAAETTETVATYAAAAEEKPAEPVEAPVAAETPAGENADEDESEAPAPVPIRSGAQKAAPEVMAKRRIVRAKRTRGAEPPQPTEEPFSEHAPGTSWRLRRTASTTISWRRRTWLRCCSTAPAMRQVSTSRSLWKRPGTTPIRAQRRVSTPGAPRWPLRAATPRTSSSTSTVPATV